MCCETDAHDELTLIRRAQQGDREAMQALLAPHRALLVSLARRLFCPESAHAELVQAGYLGLMRAVQRYDPSRGVQLMTYAVPWILGEMKSALRQLARPAGVLSLEEERGEGGASLLDVLSAGEGIDLEHVNLRLALQQLDAEEQRILCLRYFRDRTQQETACLLGRSQAQVSRMENRALDRLRTLLA